MEKKKNWFFLRLNPFYPPLFPLLQTAFTESKRGTDNVVKAQEIVYSHNQKKKEVRVCDI